MDPFYSELIAGAILIVASVGAHLYVAYVMAPPRAIERLKSWVRSDDGQKAIGDAARTQVIPAIGAAFESDGIRSQIAEGIAQINVGASLEAFLRSDPGVAWAREVGALVTSQIAAKLGSEDAAQQRASMSAAEKILMGSIDLGNPIANGIWSMAPADTRRRIVRTVYRAFRGAMAQGLDLPALTGGEGASEPAAAAVDDGGWGDTFK